MEPQSRKGLKTNLRKVDVGDAIGLKSRAEIAWPPSMLLCVNTVKSTGPQDLAGILSQKSESPGPNIALFIAGTILHAN